MAKKTVHRFTIRGEIKGEIEYDGTKPESYAAALAVVAEKRKALTDAGAEITHESGKPITVRSGSDA